MHHQPETATALLREIVDYAGLFPPAQLPMAQAVANYAEYRRSPHAWMLSRFVVPVTRLLECADAVASLDEPDTLPWELSVLLATFPADVEHLEHFREVNTSLIPATVELRANTPELIRSALDQLNPGITAYVELPSASDPEPLVEVLAELGARAKIRTGGVTADAFPKPDAVVRFMHTCQRYGVPFKATAGLHHALCSSYSLTYEPNSAKAPMYGYLNLFLAAAALHSGWDAPSAELLLLESNASTFEWSDAGVTWRKQTLTLPQIRAAREFAIAFGSCSFSEPVSEAQSFGLV